MFEGTYLPGARTGGVDTGEKRWTGSKTAMPLLHCGFAMAAIHVGADFFTIRDSKV